MQDLPEVQETFSLVWTPCAQRGRYVGTMAHSMCDLIGTCTIKAKLKQLDGSTKVSELQLLAMTCFVDPATGWFEITEVPLIDHQTSASISRLFDREWLTKRYPDQRKY